MNSSIEPRWHVLYTRPKSEKKVNGMVADMGIESYLPLHTVIHQWSDRKKRLQLPLFPNYVFVKVNGVMRASLMSISEVVNFVSIEKKPVVVRDQEIEAIKNVLSQDDDVSSEHYFQQGMNVRINYGQFAGMEGVVIKKNGRTRLVIRVEALRRAFSFNISSRYAEAICK